MQETQKMWVWFLGCEDLLEEGMATHSNILAWRTLRTEEPGRQQSSGSLESWTHRHNWACTEIRKGPPSEFSLTTQSYGEGDGNPLQYSCLENPMDRWAWSAAVHGVTKSQTRLNNFTFTFHLYALEKEMATHSSVLAWRIPGTVEPGGLPSMGSQRVRYNWSDLAASAAAALRFRYLIVVQKLGENSFSLWLLA